LVQIDDVRLRTVALTAESPRHQRSVGICKTLVARGKAASPLDIHTSPTVGKAGMKSNSGQQIIVRNIRSMRTKIHRAGDARNRKTLFDFIPQSHTAAKIPIGYWWFMLPQCLVGKTAKWARRRGTILRPKLGCRNKNGNYGYS